MDPIGMACKAIILRKLSGAVTCSIAAQIILFFSFLFAISFDIFQPFNWFQNVFRTLSSIKTWVYLFPFACIIFAQSIIYAKDYVVKPPINNSRFRKFISYFSVHNFVLLLLYVLTGVLNIWLYLSFSGEKYNSMFYLCNDKTYCLNEEYLFIILSGFWVGIFFFSGYFSRDKNIQFPVLQQHKLIQFKAKFVQLFEESQKMATWPALSYYFVYFLWRSRLYNFICNIFNLNNEIKTGLSVSCFVYVWLFIILYFFSMNLMSLFFKLFLTEAIEFPLTESVDTPLSLTLAIDQHDLPIIQHLACLDLYLLSIWSVNRRRVYYSLSQPGEHPHYWNKLFSNSLKVISQFTKSLNDSTKLILEPPKKEERFQPMTSPIKPITEEPKSPTIISPFKRNTSNITTKYSYNIQSSIKNTSTDPKYRNMRNMSLISAAPSDIIEVSYQPSKFSFNEFEIINKIKERWVNFTTKWKSIFAFSYFFKENPEIDIHTKLKDSQPIVWLTQALSNLVVAALEEDSFGVVQKDIHILLMTLLELKQAIDQLNRFVTLNKRGRGFKEHSVGMKRSIGAATKRSLCYICFKYKNCIDELPLNKDVLNQLKCFKPSEISSNIY